MPIEQRPTGDARDNLVTVAEAARLCGVSQSTVRKWHTRGLLPRFANDDLGRALYIEADVLAAELATRRKGRRRARWTYVA